MALTMTGSVVSGCAPPVAEGGRIQWVEPGSSVDAWLVAVFAPTLADPPPVPFLELLPLGLEAGVGHNDRAANGMLKRRGRLARAVFFSPNILFSRVAPACSSPRCSRAPLTRFLGLLPPAPSLGLRSSWRLCASSTRPRSCGACIYARRTLRCRLRPPTGIARNGPRTCRASRRTAAPTAHWLRRRLRSRRRRYSRSSRRAVSSSSLTRRFLLGSVALELAAPPLLLSDRSLVSASVRAVDPRPSSPRSWRHRPLAVRAARRRLRLCAFSRGPR